MVRLQSRRHYERCFNMECAGNDYLYYLDLKEEMFGMR